LSRDKGIARQFVYLTLLPMLLLCTSCRASELHVCFSIDNSFSTAYSFKKHISYVCSVFLWKCHFSVLCRAKPFIPKYVYFTLGVIIDSSQVQHCMAIHCTAHCLIYSQLLTSVHEVRHDAVSIATPHDLLYWVKYLQHLQVTECWVTMVVITHNGCIDALLTHNFKPCLVYKVSNMSIGLHHKYYLLDCR